MAEGHLNLIFPQWQGSWPDDRTLPGAMDIVARYFKDRPHRIVPVEAEATGLLENGIAEYRVILRQLESARRAIGEENPETMFSIGGGCDADILSIAYFNRKLGGDMALLWIDAHADLNIPATSPTKRFYGMPIRTLLGDGDPAILRILNGSLDPARVVQVGVREPDPPEQEYIAASGLCQLSVEEAETDPEAVLRAIRDTGCRHLYVHVDLDVLDPALFPHIPLPSAGGLRPDTLVHMLRSLRQTFPIPGLGLYEYMPAAAARVPLLEEIMRFGWDLPEWWSRLRTCPDKTGGR